MLYNNVIIDNRLLTKAVFSELSPSGIADGNSIAGELMSSSLDKLM